MMSYRIGQLAQMAGLTVRTLHHWDAIGLLTPTHRTAAGYRGYTGGDVERLYQIVALRSCGFALDDIAAVLDRRAPIDKALADHAHRIDQQITALQAVARRLTAVRTRIERDSGAGVLDPNLLDPDLLDIVREVVTMDDKIASYFEPEVLAEFAARRAELGDAAIAAVENRWPTLMAEVQQAIDDGEPPTGDRAQVLATEWMGLLAAAHGGNQQIAAGLQRIADDNADTAQSMFAGPTREQMEFIGAANAARGA
ncbi:MerR family transcriptional regulator [Williamsia sp. CHRR-6]|uniref:MerR family transcriptional regulator n=1 Tax=Williamsia sp. CHRR-6 TaxID=2835871 RepID=UPI001BDAE0F2|nr:MerR family transcriptional regulator [Williamsia sp. CHRR-6]MBT0565856.1 MerR family transcriptional regulator [Williamsia sp. CHRR-6]